MGHAVSASAAIFTVTISGAPYGEQGVARDLSYPRPPQIDVSRDLLADCAG